MPEPELEDLLRTLAPQVLGILLRRYGGSFADAEDADRRPGSKENDMKYLILIHQNRGAREQFASFPPEVQAAGMQAYYDLNAELTRTGEMVSAISVRLFKL